MDKKQIGIILLLMSLSILSYGCAPKEAEKEVIIEKEETGVSYGLTQMVKGDVTISVNLTSTYTQTKEQEISFSTGGRRISKVHVNAGDIVVAGDLLLELSEDHLQSQIDELEYKIEKNKLLLGYLDASEDFSQTSAYYSFAYGSDTGEDALEDYEGEKSDITRDYEDRREDYRDEIEFDEQKLARLKNDLSLSDVYSSMNGVVYSIKEGLEGSTSKKDEVVMTIVDNSSGFFETNAPEMSSCFKEGDLIPMKIVYGNASGDYEVTPYKMSEWGDIQRFEVVSGPENDGIEVGTTATMTVIKESKEDVMTLPLRTVFYADGKPYVYVLDENNFRQMKWIEIGLVGDTNVEILGGINEGDKVVYK